MDLALNAFFSEKVAPSNLNELYLFYLEKSGESIFLVQNDVQGSTEKLQRFKGDEMIASGAL